VVVASDSFKGSLTSLEVADAVRAGLLDASPDAVVTVVPVADGGEGTVAAALAAGWTGVPVAVHGPTGDPGTATLAVRARAAGVLLSPGRVATPLGIASSRDPATPDHVVGPVVVVELADACGLGRLPGGVPAPLTASSRGLGEALRAALDLEPEVVVVGVGGSASTDGGAGMLAALGARLLDAHGQDLPDGGAALADLDRLDLSGLDPRLGRARWVLAADVDSPLLGPAGAAAVFGPQKGATPGEVVRLEAALGHWAEVLTAALHVPESTNRSQQAHPAVPESTNRSRQAHLPGAGAAGGVGFALLAVLGAERRRGVDVVLDLIGLDEHLVGTGLVVTGEGALDTQTLAGKAVAGVAQRARAHGIPVVAVCGRLSLDDAALSSLGVRAAYALSDLEPDPDHSITDAAELLRRTGRRIAQEWLSR
jgi:glycerate kinase